jgi:RNA polymerase sigma factor (sigma-70 family)
METIKEDSQLIEDIKRRNDESEKSFLTLVNRHAPLCHDIYRKYAPIITASGLSLDDLSKDKDVVLWKCALSFDPEKKVKFSTWLGSQIRFQCLNAINNTNHYIYLDEETLQEKIDETSSISHNQNDATIDYILSILDQLKDPRIKQIFLMRYLSGEDEKQTWKKIGEKLGISTQTVINLHEKGRVILQKKLSSEVIFDKI